MSKTEIMDSVDRMNRVASELIHAIHKRDALAADVTAVNAQIAELEARLSTVEKGIGSLMETYRANVACSRSA